MPPKKRARVSQASTPQPKNATEPTSPAASHDKTNVLNDAWTDDEESQLFKSLIKYKPTGVHKHFCMIAIQNELKSHGYCAPSQSHTKIPGIWQKLDTLFDLEVLDERENNHIGILATPEDTEDDDQEDEGHNVEDPWRKRDFDLPEVEDGQVSYQELAFNKRLDDSRDSSPEAVEGLSRTRNTIGDDELREKREELDTAETASVRGRGRKIAAAKVTKGRRGRSMRSTPAESTRDEDEEDGTSTIADDSPQGKGRKGAKAAAPRRTRRR